MATRFYDLYQINFMNKSVDAKRVQGAGNKVSKELNKLYDIILEIKLQSDALEKIIYDQEYALKMLHAKISTSIGTSHHSRFLSAFDEYHRYISRIGQKTDPFITFDQQITQIFGSVEDITRMNTKEAFVKAEILVALQKILFQAYKLEHKIKLGKFEQRDAKFSRPIMKRYDKVYTGIFKDIDMLLKQIQACVEHPTPASLEKCCALLDNVKNLSRSEKIDALQKMKVI